MSPGRSWGGTRGLSLGSSGEPVAGDPGQPRVPSLVAAGPLDSSCRAGTGRETRVRLPTAAALSCSYSLSCELEPPSESASNTLKVKKNTAIVKRWSELSAGWAGARPRGSGKLRAASGLGSQAAGTGIPAPPPTAL